MALFERLNCLGKIQEQVKKVQRSFLLKYMCKWLPCSILMAIGWQAELYKNDLFR